MPKAVHRILSLVIPCLLLVSAAARATDFYVSPSGNGDGTIGNPWSLDTALGIYSPAHPGDTIWLRGGTYTGIHTSHLNGTSSSPIIVRQYPGERVTLDGGNSGGLPILEINGSYTWFWGFEIMSSDPRRQSSQSGSWPTDIYRGAGVDSGLGSAGIRLINLTIHDTAQGIGAFSSWSDTEINGCLIYYNGWVAPDRGHGHGIYAQNQYGTKSIVDNILFSGFGYGIHAYGSSAAYLDNITIKGNIIFVSGTNIDQNSRNLLLGGGRVAHNPTVSDNVLYRTGSDAPASDFDLGYSGGCANATVTGNYVSSNTYFVNCSIASMSGNLFDGQIHGFSQSQWSSNTYVSTRPTGVKVIVRPNAYEAGRANVAIFNWDMQSAVGVDLSGVLQVGQGFEIRHAMDFYGAPVVTGTYAGGSVSIPMTGLTVSAPVGWLTPASVNPEFGAFVVLPASSSGGGGGGGSAPPSGLPSPWQQSDVGSVGQIGSSSTTSGAFTVSGSGVDIWDASDEFHFVYQPLSGDGTIVARVDTIDNTDPWAKAGVMIRESLAANSTHAMTVITAGNGVAFQRRQSTGASSLDTHVAGPAAPYWVKLVRAGNTFSGYGSADGVTWSAIGSDTVAMAANVYVGLAVTSHNDGAICNASMDNVGLSNGSPTVLRMGGETGALTSPMAIFSDSGAFGGQYIATTTTNSGSASWTFTAPSTGIYYVWCRVKTPNPQEDSFFVKMDSGSEDVFDAAGSSGWGSGWKWIDLNGRGSSGISLSVNPRTFSLSAGSHTLTFRGREIQTGLDRLIITNDPAFVPTEAP